VVSRSQDSNGKVLLALQNVNWTPLNQLQTCDEMVSYFYNTVINLTNYYLPLLMVRRLRTDKPWVTDQFRHLVRCRQNALKKNEMTQYKM